MEQFPEEESVSELEEPAEVDAEAVDQTEEDTVVDENTDPATLLERLKEVRDNIGDHKVLAAATVVGAAAVTVAAILIAQKKSSLNTPEGHRLFISSGGRHAQDTVSLVEMTEPLGAASDIAVSFPTSTRAAEAVQGDSNYKKLFAMGGRDGFLYPLSNTDHVPGYRRATQKAASWLLHSFKALGEQSSHDSDI